MADFFVDFSATNDGDGTAFGQAGSPGATGAYNTLASKTFTSGDKVWMRRVTRSSDYTADITWNNTSVTFIGWPISGDVHYSTRPSAAQASWDVDVGTQAKFSFNTAAAALNVSGNTVKVHRVHVLTKTASTPPLELGANTGCEFYNSIFENNNATFNAQTFLAITGAATVFSGCTFKTAVFTTNSTHFFNVTATTLVFVNCTATITGTWTSSLAGSDTLMKLVGANPYVANFVCTIGTMAGSFGAIGLDMLGSTNPTVLGWSATVTTLSNSGSTNTLNVTQAGAVVKGFSCNFGNGITISATSSQVDITSFTQKHANTAGGLQISGNGNKVSIEQGTFVSGNTSGDFVVSGTGNKIVARNCLYPNSTQIAITGALSRALSFDHNQISGDFQYVNRVGSVVASSTARTGGETFSLKAQNISSSSISRGELHISSQCEETVWLSLATGARTVTILGAFKNFTALTAGDVWMESEYKNVSNIIIPLTTFAYGVALTSDSSTWTGDTGLTKFKLVLTFTLPSDQVVPIRIFVGKYEASSYVYIDPKPEIT